MSRIQEIYSTLKDNSRTLSELISEDEQSSFFNTIRDDIGNQTNSWATPDSTPLEVNLSYLISYVEN
jgi:hypothetical protein